MNIHEATMAIWLIVQGPQFIERCRAVITWSTRASKKDLRLTAEFFNILYNYVDGSG